MHEMDTEEEGKDMDLGDLDLEGIEWACDGKGKGYIPQEQVSFQQNSIIKVQDYNPLEIMVVSLKENK